MDFFNILFNAIISAWGKKGSRVEEGRYYSKQKP